MEHKKGFLRIYLFIALLFGLLNLTDHLLQAFQMQNTAYVQVLLLVSILFFFFNILAISIFSHHRVPGIAHILPLFHLLAFLFFFFVRITMQLWELLSSKIALILLLVGFAAATFEIVFSIYLMVKLKIMTTV